MVRAAQFVDVPVIAGLLQEGYRASIYADRAAFNEGVAKRLIVNAIQRHGNKTVGGSQVLVAENDGVVVGFIIGVLDRVYGVLDALMATDLWFYCSPAAPPRAAPHLLKATIEWAEQIPKVIEIRFGITNAVGDWERTARMYERLGLERAGAFYERQVR